MGSKRRKLQQPKEDRISDLPDHIIHHILSFFPSTKEAIRTGILSKRWRNQWTRVPVLIFDSTGMSYENFRKSIDSTLILHDCCKIKKFQLSYEKYPEITSKICFATEKNVEDLNLISMDESYMLPEFLFNYASLVKLSTYNCTVIPNGKVNWGFLTALKMENCEFSDKAIEYILSGSPLLESLELYLILLEFDKFVVASKSLKRLVLRKLTIVNNCVIEISCPNLMELCLREIPSYDPKLFTQLIENVLSDSSLLESFELIGCDVVDPLVIASNSLKRVVLEELALTPSVQISCPKLQKLKLSGCFNIKTAKLMDLTTSLCATIDFYYDWVLGSSLCDEEDHKRLIKHILRQLQHVNELTLGSWFIKILAAIQMGGLFSRALKVKWLTLNNPDLNEHHSGIACVLRCSPMLEKLEINVPPRDEQDCPELCYADFGKSYWNSNVSTLTCLVSHLKTIKIVGFPKKGDKRKLMLSFVRFLLKNARVLEKLIVVVWNDGIIFPSKLSQELLSLPRCSQNVATELLCST